MVAIIALLSSALLTSSFLVVSAAPPHPKALDTPRGNVKGILCNIPVIRLLCPRGGASNGVVSTPLGSATGVSSVPGARRFAVQYATAARWQESSLVNQWKLPNGASDPAAMPLSCPQYGADASAVSEDCLSMILYVPDSLEPNANTMVWIHGGSFIKGSATAPGLDGSKLAISTKSIVVTIQYRLGALGFLAPNGPTNLAVKDTINALKFLGKVLPSFGGSASRITLAGQSSGGTMIRSLLAAPSASSLFKSAIMASDPMDYGILYMSTQATLQDYFNTHELINCAPTDTACLNALPLDNIINAQDDLYYDANYLDGAAGQGSPIRPVQDGVLITSPLDSTGPFPAVSKPILVTTVLHEAADTIYGNFEQAIDKSFFEQAVAATFHSPRAETVLSAPYYQVADGSDPRPVLEKMGTDYLWKCSAWTFARNWIQHGGTAYVGMYVAGASYPGNERVPYCRQSGVVCHQDDIQIIFGTVQNPTPAQTALVTEVQKRFKAFLSNGNPNAPGVSTWQAATTSDVRTQILGGAGPAVVGACDPAFWGNNPEYDYQYYHNN